MVTKNFINNAGFHHKMSVDAKFGPSELFGHLVELFEGRQEVSWTFHDHSKNLPNGVPILRQSSDAYAPVGSGSYGVGATRFIELVVPSNLRTNLMPDKTNELDVAVKSAAFGLGRSLFDPSPASDEFFRVERVSFGYIFPCPEEFESSVQSGDAARVSIDVGVRAYYLHKPHSTTHFVEERFFPKVSASLMASEFRRVVGRVLTSPGISGRGCFGEAAGSLQPGRCQYVTDYIFPVVSGRR